MLLFFILHSFLHSSFFIRYSNLGLRLPIQHSTLNIPNIARCRRAAARPYTARYTTALMCIPAPTEAKTTMSPAAME
jgi:hypothetical protein